MKLLSLAYFVAFAVSTVACSRAGKVKGTRKDNRFRFVSEAAGASSRELSDSIKFADDMGTPTVVPTNAPSHGKKAGAPKEGKRSKTPYPTLSISPSEAPSLSSLPTTTLAPSKGKSGKAKSTKTSAPTFSTAPTELPTASSSPTTTPVPSSSKSKGHSKDYNRD